MTQIGTRSAAALMTSMCLWKRMLDSSGKLVYDTPCKKQLSENFPIRSQKCVQYESKRLDTDVAIKNANFFSRDAEIRGAVPRLAASNIQEFK